MVIHQAVTMKFWYDTLPRSYHGDDRFDSSGGLDGPTDDDDDGGTEGTDITCAENTFAVSPGGSHMTGCQHCKGSLWSILYLMFFSSWFVVRCCLAELLLERVNVQVLPAICLGGTYDGTRRSTVVDWH